LAVGRERISAAAKIKTASFQQAVCPFLSNEAWAAASAHDERVCWLVDVRSRNLRAARFAALHKDLRLAARNEAARRFRFASPCVSNICDFRT
jgi:hypothetical protein